MLLLLASLAFADTGLDRSEATPLHGTDTDEDSWPDSVDCAIEDPTIFPGADERCNGLDDDCNGVVDDVPELCDGLDNDCDGEIDEAEECRACGGEGTESEAGALMLLPLVWSRRRRRIY